VRVFDADQFGVWKMALIVVWTNFVDHFVQIERSIFRNGHRSMMNAGYLHKTPQIKRDFLQVEAIYRRNGALLPNVNVVLVAEENFLRAQICVSHYAQQIAHGS